MFFIFSLVEKVIFIFVDVYDFLMGFEKMGYFIDLLFDFSEGMKFEKVDIGKGIELEVCDFFF